ncbi:MAG: glycine oxidase ThiO [Methylomonas sp.]|jgi:glycine oxidase
MTLHTDILIIGGGVSGLLTALELRKAGRDVALIDKSALGRESSWAGGGILLPIYPWRQAQAISELVYHSLKSYPDLVSELFAETGIDPELRDCGMLVCKNPDETAALAWLQKYRISGLSAGGRQTSFLNTEFQNALWLPEIAHVRNPRLLQSLSAYLRKIGVRFFEGAVINHIEIDRRRIQRLISADRQFTCNELIICAGAWTAEILKQWLPAAKSPPIQPVKGQMLLFSADPETLPFMVLDGEHYLIPRRDGKILAGSTVESVGFDKSVTRPAKEELYDFATRLLPRLRQYPLSMHWAGLRPGSADGVPFIGRHPDFGNLSINAGHFRNGVVMGPASARLLADLLLERPTGIDPQPYAVK